jgi:hypothetical protein
MEEAKRLRQLGNEDAAKMAEEQAEMFNRKNAEKEPSVPVALQGEEFDDVRIERMPASVVPRFIEALPEFIRTNAINQASAKFAEQNQKSNSKQNGKKMDTEQKFDSIVDAKKAGHKPGDVILLWNPARNKYGKFQID